MFSRHGKNLKPLDSFIRIFFASVILIYAINESSYILAIVSALLYYTGFSKFCFAYFFFKINERFSSKNYYLTFLPKHNPSAVFIFNKKENLVFKNAAAAKELPDVFSSSCLGIQDTQTLLAHSITKKIMFKNQERFYQIALQSLKEEQILLAYLTDVTEVIQLNDEIEETQREIIYAMGEIGETRSKETGNHVKRVALYSKELALLYGLSSEEADILHMASPMHDIGKVGIPDAVLNAPRKLDIDEWKIMQTHSRLGYEMLKGSNKPILQAAAIVANEHHEKWDGSGYPRALKEENIHIYGRITAVADVFDALGSERVYKKAWELDKILALFKEERGKHFDPKLIDLFLNNLDNFLTIRDRFKDVL